MTRSDARAFTQDVAELLSDHIWTHTSEMGKRDPGTPGLMRGAGREVRRAIARLAGLSRMPTDEEWNAATDIIARRVMHRRELAGR